MRGRPVFGLISRLRLSSSFKLHARDHTQSSKRQPPASLSLLRFFVTVGQFELDVKLELFIQLVESALEKCNCFFDSLVRWWLMLRLQARNLNLENELKLAR